MTRPNNEYDDYELGDRYDQMAEDAMFRQHGRMVNKVNRTKKSAPTRQEEIASLVEENTLLEDFVPTYAANLDPKHFERSWVIGSLGGFWRDEIISDVLYQVKAGKEANVYACAGSNSSEHKLLAAKLYRPRMFRHLRNDAAYKIGRLTHSRDGKKIRKNSGVERAIKKKSNFGQSIEFSNWIGHEYRVQQALWDAGADVPEPIAHAKNTIIMQYCGDQTLAAPTLIDVALRNEEAPRLFDQIIYNVRLMLSLNQVHGDLSAYNILYWKGDITIIDFPQMVDATVNPHARRFLQRDIKRVVDYFSQFGVSADSEEIAQSLWIDFLNNQLTV